MNIRKVDYHCDRCAGIHSIEVDIDSFTEAQRTGKEPVVANFVCPDMALMYRVVGFAFDFTVNSVKGPHIQESIVNNLKERWGAYDFDVKLNRFKDLNLSFMGVSDEYYSLLQPIISAYCCGYFYPAMTSAGALGERILNRLMLKTRDYFKSSPLYKKVYGKESSDRWDFLVQVLKEWKVISNDVADLFQQLNVYRNDSIHYNDGYDFEGNSHKAIKLLAGIVNGQFNYLNRPDLFWLFDCPGEVWIRSSALSDPFVKEFVLPHALPLTPFCEPTATPPVRGTNVPIKPLTDEEFIRIRNERNKKA